MTTATWCPPVRDLRALAEGQNVGAALEALLQHLEDCPRCLEIVHDLENVTAAQAVGDTPGASLPPAEECAATWRGGLPPTANSSPPEKRSAVPAPPAGPATASSPKSAKPTDSLQALLSLLAPAENPEEVGRLGPYRLLQVLGSGATGVVFLAEDQQLSRRVALKVMKPVEQDAEVARQRFLREARAAAGIDHEHLITIYQVGADRGVPYLAMKLLQGETLDDRLKREGQLLLYEALRIGREVAEGLDAAHERGLIHRDIKPANIFLEGPQARVRIVDFGLARAASDDQHLTRTGTIVGTPAYMSPEQARGGAVDHRSDLFSLGCLLYRACTGRTPFRAEDTMGLLVALAQDQPPPMKAFNPEVPDLLEGLVVRLLAKRPEARPQSAGQVAERLKAIEDMLVACAATGKRPRDQRPAPRSSRRLLITVLKLVAVAGLVWAGYAYGPMALREGIEQFKTRWWDEATKHRSNLGR